MQVPRIARTIEFMEERSVSIESQMESSSQLTSRIVLVLGNCSLVVSLVAPRAELEVDIGPSLGRGRTRCRGRRRQGLCGDVDWRGRRRVGRVRRMRRGVTWLGERESVMRVRMRVGERRCSRPRSRGWECAAAGATDSPTLDAVCALYTRVARDGQASDGSGGR